VLNKSVKKLSKTFLTNLEAPTHKQELFKLIIFTHIINRHLVYEGFSLSSKERF